jgi:hypothetical protein
MNEKGDGRVAGDVFATEDLFAPKIVGADAAGGDRTTSTAPMVRQVLNIYIYSSYTQ